MSIYGQSSGDFKESSGRVQLLYVVTRNTYGPLTADSFTQANPSTVTAHASSTLSGITKVGVLGSSFAFTRKDVGNGYVGPCAKVSSVYTTYQHVVGVFINDALGNPFENTPGVASNRGPYICGSGSLLALSLYETKLQISGTPGNAITWVTGDKVYASVNGLATNVVAEAYEYQLGPDATNVTLCGIVRQAPESPSNLLIIELRV